MAGVFEWEQFDADPKKNPDVEDFNMSYALLDISRSSAILVLIIISYIDP